MHVIDDVQFHHLFPIIFVENCNMGLDGYQYWQRCVQGNYWVRKQKGDGKVLDTTLDLLML